MCFNRTIVVRPCPDIIQVSVVVMIVQTQSHEWFLFDVLSHESSDDNRRRVGRKLQLAYLLAAQQRLVFKVMHSTSVLTAHLLMNLVKPIAQKARNMKIIAPSMDDGCKVEQNSKHQRGDMALTAGGIRKGSEAVFFCT
jgi:hypothetical protein